MIWDDYPVMFRNSLGKITVKERPSWVAMNHKYWRPITFIDVMKVALPDIKGMALKRIKVGIFLDPR